MLEVLNKFPDNQVPRHLIKTLFLSPKIEQVKIFALGPKGTNIEKATNQWIEIRKIKHKSKVFLCETPEEEVAKALTISEGGTLPIFALCAVYFKLHELFFSYCECNFFLDHFYMPLDEMQVAARNTIDHIGDKVVAAHFSPSPLVKYSSGSFIETNSNSHAAKICAEGKVDACVTTETAKNIYSLQTIHKFGSPIMLFTFGTTTHGIKLLCEAEQEWRQ